MIVYPWKFGELKKQLGTKDSKIQGEILKARSTMKKKEFSEMLKNQNS
jgi:hypothetical protein